MSATDTTHVDAFAPPLLTAGDVVSERYRIQALVGEGGMGVVYRVEHTHLRKQYALKVLRSECSSSREVVARFEREAIAAGRIQSPHVVAATDFGRLDDGSFFLVMEYVKGRTLRSVLGAGALALDRALHILRGIIAALHAAHELGIVHRDVKPENVMLVERDGDPDFVKVLDFGLAKADGLTGGAPASGTTALTQAGMIMGTLQYMSPEQACGQRVDGRSDMYSAGVILFEMLTGECPFRGGAATLWRQHVAGDVPELPVDVAARHDPRLGAILRRMLAALPEHRFANADDLMAALDDLACHPSAAAAPSPSPPQSEPVHGTAMLAADRIRRLLQARLDATRAAARRILGDREALLRHVTRRRLIIGVLVLVALVTIAVVIGTGDDASRETSRGAVRSTDPVSVVAPNSHAAPPADPAAGASDVPLVNLPPPPTPPSANPDDEGDDEHPPSPGSPQTPNGKTRHTGPGGIYVPPPGQWFR